MNGAAGRLEAIWIKRVRRGPMDPVEEAELVADRGIEGNANAGGKRQVTLLEAEKWKDVQEELGAEVDPTARRANLYLRGVVLTGRRGAVLRVGSCRLEVHGETRGCRLMDETHPGLQAALGEDWRGGAFATVLDSGTIRVGDPVAWEDGASETDAEGSGAASPRPTA